MSLEETFRTQLAEAMRSGDTLRRNTLRLVIASSKNARIAAQHDLSDDEVLGVLRREAKQRRDSIEEYTKGKRPDLVAQEQAELEIIESYLPASVPEDDVRAAAIAVIAEVGATGPGEIGKVMRPLLQRLGGGVDGRRANEIVRELLGAG
ncbi:MAG: GatB/YqeY domain-containing protein [Dehalococcoidia bacterium]|nr:GatB/YqeY domain-containing protein [Dehalococcoidia bacterium]